MLNKNIEKFIQIFKTIDIGETIYIVPYHSLGLKKITAYRILDFHKNDLGLGMNLMLIENEKGLQKFVRLDVTHIDLAFKTYEEAEKHHKLLIEKYKMGILSI